MTPICTSLLMTIALAIGGEDASKLESELREIAANEYRVPAETSAAEVARRMLEHLGSPDPDLRDGLVYTTFALWIRRGHFETAEMKELVETLSNDDHLFHGIGEVDTDSVFRRSFAALVLSELVRRHVQEAYLEADAVAALQARAVDYLEKENDLRGFVEGKGFAHAVAHTADLLDQLVRCEGLDEEDHQKMLTAIRGKMATTRVLYGFGEEWRMAKVILTLLRTESVTDRQMGGWLRDISRDLLRPLQGAGATEQARRYANMKSFLLNIHLRCMKEQPPVDITAQVFATLARITKTSEN